MTTDQLAIEQAKRVCCLERELEKVNADIDRYRLGVRRLQEIVDEKDGVIASLKVNPESMDQRELERLKAYNDDLAKEVNRLMADNMRLSKDHSRCIPKDGLALFIHDATQGIDVSRWAGPFTCQDGINHMARIIAFQYGLDIENPKRGDESCANFKPVEKVKIMGKSPEGEKP